MRPAGTLVGVMAAVDEEAPGLDRRSSRRTLATQSISGSSETRRARSRGARSARADGVGRFGEVAADLPEARAVLDLEDADADRLGVEALERVGQRLGAVASGRVVRAVQVVMGPRYAIRGP
jgi:hypothetical protein